MLCCCVSVSSFPQIGNEAKYAEASFDGALYASTATPAVDWSGTGLPLNRTAVFLVSATVSLSGFTVTTFNTTMQAAFTATLASTLNVFPNAITITSVTATAAAGGRHLLQSGVTVAFTVASPSSAIATTLTASVAAATSGAGATAFTASLNDAFSAAGASGTTTVTVVSAPVAAQVSGAARGAATAVLTVALAAAAALLA
jgi:hypothetical protein